MFLLRKIIFKLMELGLGLKAFFSLDTRNPIFVNMRLSATEAEQIQKTLPPGFTLKKARFSQDDPSPEYWLSYNLYEIRYPKKELQEIVKVRCEINTFVEDSLGRKGVFVFCGSPYVSREEKKSLLGRICDLAERTVIFIYGCGRLARMSYCLSETGLRIELEEGSNKLSLDQSLPGPEPARMTRLSDEYWVYNDISFFNQGKTYDLVNVNSAFKLAEFQGIEGTELGNVEVQSPFFRRRPDRIYLHRGDISYMVSSLNRG